MTSAMRSQPSLAGARVLIVEDESIVALALTHLLDDLGCNVLGPVPTVRGALGLLEIEQPDVALLDVNLRGQLVTPVAAKLGLLGVPFVLVTGQTVAELPATELRQSCWVPKPIVEDILVRTVAGALGR
jgi:two-component SAPR family response regulator